jgi:Helicase conserved C-terminal domain
LRIGETATPPAAIRQTIFPVLQESKAAMLLHLLRRDAVAPTIVFARTRSRADRVAKLLLRNLVNAVVIHGGRTQNQRNAALAWFRNGQYAVRVATDVAERALDRALHRATIELPSKAIAAARMAFDKGPWPWMRPAERSTVLMQFHDEPVARSPEIAILVVKESGAR